MLLQALTKYYEILSDDEDVVIPQSGYSKVGVSYIAVISYEGKLSNIISCKILDSRGKKEIPKEMIVPEQEKKTSGIKANFICENSSYLFGIDGKGKPERAVKCFEAYKKLQLEILENIEDDEVKAIINYLNRWEPEKAEENPVLGPYIEEIVKGANIILQYEGSKTFCHQNANIKKAWILYKENTQSMAIRQCLVTGEKGAYARLHPNLKGVKGGQSMGCSLVSFNAPADESYGKDKSQGDNAPVSEYATFAYSTALNHMLDDRNHKFFLGDSTVVYWAETTNSHVQNLMALFFDPSKIVEDDANEIVRDEKTIDLATDMFEKVRTGTPLVFDKKLIDSSTKIYILGLSPNAARLSVRFFVVDNLEGFIKKMARHYSDIQIEKQYDNEVDAVPLWRILNETVSPNSREKASSPLLAGATMRSILNGLSYPLFLYQAILIRIKAEHNINYYKAAIIKGYLIRKDRHKYEEELTMALNEQSTNKSYVLGRLFAVLEKTQEDANHGIKSTIKDRYFTSACTTPSIVFPVILKLSNHHISKSEYGYSSENKIKAIMALLDVEEQPFPKNLSLDDQGVFILGYYHQKNAFYKKVEKES